MVFWMRSSTRLSSLARVSFMVRCFGPVLSAVMNGRLISVCVVEDSSILAFSAASFRRCKRQLVVAQIDAVLFLELVGEIIDDAHVEVFAAEEGVAVGRLHLEHAVADLEDGNVERAAAEVVDGDGLCLPSCRARRRARPRSAR